MNNYKNLTETRMLDDTDGRSWTLYNKLYNDGTPESIAREWKHEFYNAILEHVPDKSVVVQAGGWQGVYPALLSEIFETVYTFEPDPVNFYCLTENCQKHNIFKFQFALGGSVGTAVFEEVLTSGQGRIQQPNPWVMPVHNAYSVPMMSIDAFPLEKCGLIMLDTENLDYDILLGSVNTIEKFKPVIITEKSFKPYQITATMKLLAQLGYTLKVEWGENFMFVPIT